MGSVVGAITSVAKAPFDALSGGGGQQWNGGALQPSMDPQLTAMRDQQVQDAASFKANLPQEQARQESMAEDVSRSSLAAKMQNINSQANSRGLLYSGLKSGAQVGAQAEAAGNLAQNKAQIGQNLNQQSNQMSQGAIAAGLNYAKMQRENQNAMYDNAIKQRQLQSQQATSLFRGIGSIAGSAAGSGK